MALGKVQGFYVDRNLSITKEISSEDLDEKMKSIFPTRKEMDLFNKELADDLFSEDEKED